jgi:hypothetical protein
VQPPDHAGAACQPLVQRDQHVVAPEAGRQLRKLDQCLTGHPS